MERRINFSIERGSYYDSGIWQDILLKDGQPVQAMTLKLEMPFDIKKRESNAILLHSRMLDNPFYITLDPNDSKIKYQQGIHEEIMLVSNIKDTLKDQLLEYFNEILEGEKPLAAFEFSDKENVSDPIGPNQSAGKRRRKTRRSRRS